MNKNIYAIDADDEHAIVKPKPTTISYGGVEGFKDMPTHLITMEAGCTIRMKKEKKYSDSNDKYLEIFKIEFVTEDDNVMFTIETASAKTINDLFQELEKMTSKIYLTNEKKYV